MDIDFLSPKCSCTKKITLYRHEQLSFIPQQKNNPRKLGWFLQVFLVLKQKYWDILCKWFHVCKSLLTVRYWEIKLKMIWKVSKWWNLFWVHCKKTIDNSFYWSPQMDVTLAFWIQKEWPWNTIISRQKPFSTYGKMWNSHSRDKFLKHTFSLGFWACRYCRYLSCTIINSRNVRIFAGLYVFSNIMRQN